MRFIAAALLVAGALGAPAAAQDAGVTRTAAGASAVDLSGLKPAQVRKLDHYANKLLEEIAALVKAQGEQDQEAEKLHGEQLGDLAERYMKAAGDSGLDRQSADLYFQSALAKNYTGKLPRQLISASGVPSIEGLLVSDSTAPAPASAETAKSEPQSFIDYLRSEGKTTFGD